MESKLPLSKPKSRQWTWWVSVILGGWLVVLLVGSLWFQNQFVRSFLSERQAESFLQPSQAQDWYNRFSVHLPEKSASTRIVQFWRPDCLCNRFAAVHASNTLGAAQKQSVEHITVIPTAYSNQINQIQQLNPKTNVLSLSESLMETWPSSPSLFLENGEGKLYYFGPLGFGAFCTQASTNIVERQMAALNEGRAHPFLNVVGQGCFCDWAK